MRHNESQRCDRLGAVLVYTVFYHAMHISISIIKHLRFQTTTFVSIWSAFRVTDISHTFMVKVMVVVYMFACTGKKINCVRDSNAIP